MNNDWQQESANTSPRTTGGPLGGYGQLPSQQLLPVQQSNQQASSLQPGASARPTDSGLLSQRQNNQQPQRVDALGGLLGNAFETIRSWSGKLTVVSNKMAVMAGY